MISRPTKILIIGSAGAVGSNIIRKIIFDKLPYQLVGVDDLSSDNSEKNLYVNKNYSFHLATALDIKILEKIFDLEKPDAVINLLQCKNPIDEIQGMHNVIQCCLSRGIDKVVYLSTDQVYSSPSGAKEDDACSADNVCSIAKLACENLLQISRLKYTILRPTSVFGIRQDAHSLLPYAIASIIDQFDFPDAGINHNLISMDDLIDGILLSISSTEMDRRIFNVSAPFNLTDGALINLIASLLNKSGVKSPTTSKEIPFSQEVSLDSSELISQGWQAKSSNIAGLEQVVKWYSNNRWFLNLSSSD